MTLDARFQIQRSPVSSEALSELIKQSKASTLAPMVEYVRKGIRKFGCNYTTAKVIQLLQEQSPFLKKEVKSLLEHAITNASNPLAKSDSKKIYEVWVQNLSSSRKPIRKERSRPEDLKHPESSAIKPEPKPELLPKEKVEFHTHPSTEENYFDVANELTINGNECVEKGDYERALEFYKKAASYYAKCIQEDSYSNKEIIALKVLELALKVQDPNLKNDVRDIQELLKQSLPHLNSKAAIEIVAQAALRCAKELPKGMTMVLPLLEKLTISGEAEEQSLSKALAIYINDIYPASRSKEEAKIPDSLTLLPEIVNKMPTYTEALFQLCFDPIHSIMKNSIENASQSTPQKWLSAIQIAHRNFSLMNGIKHFLSKEALQRFSTLELQLIKSSLRPFLASQKIEGAIDFIPNFHLDPDNPIFLSSSQRKQIIFNAIGIDIEFVQQSDPSYSGPQWDIPGIVPFYMGPQWSPLEFDLSSTERQKASVFKELLPREETGYALICDRDDEMFFSDGEKWMKTGDRGTSAPVDPDFLEHIEKINGFLARDLKLAIIYQLQLIHDFISKTYQDYRQMPIRVPDKLLSGKISDPELLLILVDIEIIGKTIALQKAYEELGLPT